MKKILISFSFIFIIVSAFSCAGTQKPDPAVIACKEKCDKTFESCTKKANKNEAKKAACEAVRNKCSTDCEKK